MAINSIAFARNYLLLCQLVDKRQNCVQLIFFLIKMQNPSSFWAAVDHSVGTWLENPEQGTAPHKFRILVHFPTVGFGFLLLEFTVLLIFCFISL